MKDVACYERCCMLKSDDQGHSKADLLWPSTQSALSLLVDTLYPTPACLFVDNLSLYFVDNLSLLTNFTLTNSTLHPPACQIQPNSLYRLPSASLLSPPSLFSCYLPLSRCQMCDSLSSVSLSLSLSLSRLAQPLHVNLQSVSASVHIYVRVCTCMCGPV